jgi:hypothetical protein
MSSTNERGIRESESSVGLQRVDCGSITVRMKAGELRSKSRFAGTEPLPTLRLENQEHPRKP